MKIREFYVPVLWGQVAVKAWGDENDPKILVVHGLQDNAASFDLLIPLLPPTFYYVCIDWPSHGNSSHFPPHTPLYLLNFVLTLRLVTNYFKWQRYTIMAHSIGAMTATLFTMMFPENIEKLINIDGMVFYPVQSENVIKYVKTKFENLLKYEKSIEETPGLPYTQILDTFIKKRTIFPISKAAAELLLTRCLIEVAENQYKVSTDDRIGFCFLRPIYNLPYIVKAYQERPLTCPVLIILADQNKYQLKLFESFIKFLKKQKNVQIVQVNGDHNVHLHNPEKVAPIITKFLVTSSKNKL